MELTGESEDTRFFPALSEATGTDFQTNIIINSEAVAFLCAYEGREGVSKTIERNGRTSSQQENSCDITHTLNRKFT